MADNIHIYLVFSIFLITCGIYGVIVQKTMFGMLLSAKLIFLAAAINFTVFDRFIFKGSGEGELFSFVIIILSVSSMIVVSGFILAFYRENRSLDTDYKQ